MCSFFANTSAIPTLRLTFFSFLSSTTLVLFCAIEIPQCPEQDVAVAQLDRDGGEDSDKLTALAFQFREMSETAATAAAERASTSQAEFGVSPFFTPCGPLKALGPDSADLDFSIRAPTTSKNLYRVLRALQVRFAQSLRYVHRKYGVLYTKLAGPVAFDLARIG